MTWLCASLDILFIKVQNEKKKYRMQTVMYVIRIQFSGFSQTLQLKPPDQDTEYWVHGKPSSVMAFD